MNKKGYVLIIVIVILVAGIFILGKPVSVWIAEKFTNKTLMPKINPSNFSWNETINQEIDIIKNLTNSTNERG